MLKFGGFDLQWPSMLWLMLLLPLVVLLYWRAVAGQRRRARRTGVSLLLGAQPGVGGWWRRQLPAWLLFGGLAAMLFAIARPQAVIALPSRVETVVLALDMSGSMRATDIKPNRIAAAQQAARAFVEDQPRHVRVGVVAVAGTAAVVQSPTQNREDVIQAINRLQPQRGTALGSGLIISLATLLPDAGLDVEDLIDAVPGSGARRPGVKAPRAAGRPFAGADAARSSGDGDGSAAAGDARSVTPGSNPSSVVVLLTDGQSNTGPDVASAVDVANQYGVRIYTVGVGTTEGATVSADGWSMRVRLDEAGLKKIANDTGAEYFQAGSAGDLKKIYRYVSAKLAMGRREPTEVTALFAALGALLAMAGGLLSMWWHNRLL